MILFAAAACLLVSTGCETPSVRLDNALLKKLTSTGLEVGLDMTVLNPNEYQIPLQSVDWDLDLFQAPFTNGQSSFTTNIPPNRTANFEVPLGISFNTVSVGVQNVLTKRAIPWGFEGACSFRTPAGPIRVGFQRDGSWANPLMR
jgi:LEA14-like dessication related protein